MAAGDITIEVKAGATQGGFSCGTALCDIDAILYVECGFQPSKIYLLVNSTNEGLVEVMWHKGMTAGTFLQKATAGDKTLVTTYGPIVYAGSAADDAEGFAIPVDLQDATGLNCADSDTIYWQAWR